MKKTKNLAAQFSSPEIWSVPDLLGLPEGDNPWIIDGLLRRGNQMLLAGPPKSGKTLIAAEIALALSRPWMSGEERFLFGARRNEEIDFPGFKIHAKGKGGQPWKVLFFSLEMREAEIASRLRCQLTARVSVDSQVVSGESKPTPKFQLHHIFGLPGNKSSPELRQDLEVLETVATKAGHPPKVQMGPDAKAIQEIIQSQKPDVVIFDTLIQLHSVNENDNVLMKGVMRVLRRSAVINRRDGSDQIADPVAHIVVHHTRKEGGHFKAPLSPEIMRGAGAVHGVADLVMLARPAYKKDTLEVHVSSRSSSIPNFFLSRDRNSLSHTLVRPDSESAKSPAQIRPIDQIREIFRSIVLKEVKEAGSAGKRFSTKELGDLVRTEARTQKIKTTNKFDKTFLDKLMRELVAEKTIDWDYIGHKRKLVNVDDCKIKLPGTATSDEPEGVEIEWDSRWEE